MLVYGTCNPEGENNFYNGLYLTDKEIRSMVNSRELHGIPVKTEHKGSDVGKIVSTYIGDQNELKCLLDIDDKSFDGGLAAGFVRDNIACELSLGYTVDVRHTENSRLKAGKKNVLEVSLVRKGARNGCQITMYTDGDKVYVKQKSNECDAPTCFEPYFSVK